MISEKMFSSYYELYDKWQTIPTFNWQDWTQRSFPKERIENAIECISSLDYDFTKSLTLLDLACENGLYSIPACSKFKKVIGIDNDEFAIKKANITKEHYSNQGFNTNNLEFKNIGFWEYGLGEKFLGQEGVKWDFHKPEFRDEFLDLFKNSILEADNINAVLVCEFLNFIDDNGVKFFKRILENLKLIIIQTKYLTVEQWLHSPDDYSRYSGNYEDGLSNSFNLYSQSGIVSLLEEFNFSISYHNKNSNSGLVIGINNDFNIS